MALGTAGHKQEDEETPKQLNHVRNDEGSEGHLDITTNCPGTADQFMTYLSTYMSYISLLTLKPFCCSYHPGSHSYGESGKVSENRRT